ncbi:hypothetical protein [uncultured Rhodoblastus sp.]|uniref:hypothetical protein n=1 Tax=uncultured Rhodoblastus sp. TaxID=543037 RepID=UPI0025D7FE78|nr:hypothetical protein [uncultured Rhodoblastus sp.]
MTDKPEPTREETIWRLENKVMALWGAICSADFVFQDTVIQGAARNGDDRYIIDISEADFSGLVYAMGALSREVKDFKEFFYRELEGQNNDE